MNSIDIVLGIIFTTLLILLLIAGVAISFFSVGKQRVKQQIELTEAKLKYEKELRKVETEVSEHLMQLFAQELHDNIGHTLTCIRLEVENKKLDHPAQGHLFSQVETYLDDASTQLRLLSRSHNSDYITHIGLGNAIQLEVERQQQLKKFVVHFEKSYVGPLLDKDQELMVFRIFQEIIHNAMRHSKAKNVYITLHDSPQFELSVRDDGEGFLIEDTLLTPKASGLKNVLKRAAMANIVCKIDSAPGAGCQYQLSREITFQFTPS